MSLNNDHASVNIRAKLFGRFFKLRHKTLVAKNGEQLNRECSLFTDNGNYVIVGSAMNIPEEPHPLFHDIYQNNESMSPNHKYQLEDYSLHIIDLETGILCDTRHFKFDKIFLSHNQGLYLYKNTLAILSVQQQTIHIFHVTPTGKFVDVRSIGRFCYEDDQLFFSQGSKRSSGQVIRPYAEQTINSLKHRLMVFLFHRAQAEGTSYALRKFYQYFDQFKVLRMWKMQLLDENHLLIKYASEDVVTLKCQDPNSQPSFFVVYNMMTTEVLAVFENTSEKLLELFENFCDLFRNATLHSESQFPCSASSNIHARQIQQRFKHTIINAKFGGHTEAVKRLLAQLPISSQSYSSSPYLDLALFSYDDKWVSMMERPKACGDHPIRLVNTLKLLHYHMNFSQYPFIIVHLEGEWSALPPPTEPWKIKKMLTCIEKISKNMPWTSLPHPPLDYSQINNYIPWTNPPTHPPLKKKFLICKWYYINSSFLGG